MFNYFLFLLQRTKNNTQILFFEANIIKNSLLCFLLVLISLFYINDTRHDDVELKEIKYLEENISIIGFFQEKHLLRYNSDDDRSGRLDYNKIHRKELNVTPYEVIRNRVFFATLKGHD